MVHPLARSFGLPSFARRLVATLGLLVALTGCPQTTPDPPGERCRAVVLVTIDGLHGDALSLFDGPEATPALEQLAAAGRAWEDVWTSAPMTRPAVASYLTGLAGDQHGVRDDAGSVLAGDLPTLATLFEQRGWATAAFPDSRILDQSSGLLRGFGVVDDPPPGSERWLPPLRAPEATADHVRRWLDRLPAGQAYFLWVHFSHPLRAQLERLADQQLREVMRARRKAAQARERESPQQPDTGVRLRPLPPASPAPDAAQQPGTVQRATRAEVPDIAEVDAALGTILGVLQARGDLRRALVVVAGTMADVTGGDTIAVGPGFSLDERAVRVPVVARFPADVELGRSAEEPAWALDVPATIADLAGLTLPERAEGSSLLEPAAEDRVLVVRTWAPLDQLAWPAQRAARIGPFKRIEGAGAVAEQIRLDGAPGEVPADVVDRLASALAARPEPAAPLVPVVEVRPLLESRGLALDPIPAEGRVFGNAEERRELTATLWWGRVLVNRGTMRLAARRYQTLQQLDPDCLAQYLDRGLGMALADPAQGLAFLSPAVVRYPDRPDVLHAFAHAIWAESVSDATRLIELVLPYAADRSDLLYDLACAHSLREDLDGSERYLRAAIEAGYDQWQHMETDPDLRKLRESGRFSALVQQYRQ